MVRTAVSDGHGGVYLAGDITQVGGAGRAQLLHVRADGTVDAAFAPPRFQGGPSLSPGPKALALAGNTRCTSAATSRRRGAGERQRAGAQTRQKLAAVDASDGHLLAFDPNLTMPYGEPRVNALAVRLGSSFVARR